MSIFDKRVRVSVNGVEVPNSPVSVPVEIEVDTPLPPLPMRSLAPFTEHPVCSRCGCKRVEWQFWPRYHAPCPDPFYVAYPSYPGGYPFRANDPREMRDFYRAVKDADRVLVTQPPHHDIKCLRCGFAWVISALAEDCE